MHLAHLLGTNLMIRFELRRNFSLTWVIAFGAKKGRRRHSPSSKMECSSLCKMNLGILGAGTAGMHRGLGLE